MPIWFLVTIILAFAWLFYESDWMRIRLPVGVESITIEDWANTFMQYPSYYINNSKYEPILGGKRVFVKVNRDMFLNPGLGKVGNNGYLSPGVDDILPSWDWLESRKHPVPEYRFEIIAWGCTHKIHLKPQAIMQHPNIIKDISQVALKPTKEQRQEIKRQNKARKGSEGK